MLARSPRWRMTASGVAAVFRDCLEHPDRSGPRARRRGLRLPPRRRAGWSRRAAGRRSSARRPRHPTSCAAWRARRPTCACRPPRPPPHALPARRADARPQARRGAADRQPRALPRARPRRDDLGARSTASWPREELGALDAPTRRRAARGVPDRLAPPAASTTPRVRSGTATAPTTDRARRAPAARPRGALQRAARDRRRAEAAVGLRAARHLTRRRDAPRPAGRA